MQDLPQMPPLQPIFTAAQPTPYEQMLLTLAQAESLLFQAEAMVSRIECDNRAELLCKIDAAKYRAYIALSFARKPDADPEAQPDDDPKHSQNEEWYMEQARERGLL